MKRKLPMFIRITLGVIFLIIGIFGIFLPILQGWIFLILAAGFLGWDGLRLYIRRVRNKLRRWF